jgi:hypothetical protein
MMPSHMLGWLAHQNSKWPSGQNDMQVVENLPIAGLPAI